MIFYRLSVPQDEQSDDPDEEWFTSATEARTRRAEILREAGGECSASDLWIERVTLVGLPPRALLLLVLNRRGFVAERKAIS